MKMFKQVLHITWFCLILTFFSCAGESRYEDASAPVEESKSMAGNSAKFTEELNINKLPESLSKEQQGAFELRAQQKFQDFLDYLKIVSNPKMDKGLVKHSEQLMKELFISDTITIYDADSILYGTKNHNNPLPLFDYLKGYKQVSHKKEITSKVKSFSYTKSLQKDTLNNFYTGRLQAEMILNNKKTLKTVNIYLIETTKQFGDTELKSIEIKLGNIY